MSAKTTTDPKLLKSWAQERHETKLDELIARCVIELETAQADLRQVRIEADRHAILEDQARQERERLTRAFELEIQKTAVVIGAAAVARNAIVFASHKERMARARLQNAREQLTQ